MVRGRRNRLEANGDWRHAPDGMAVVMAMARETVAAVSAVVEASGREVESDGGPRCQQSQG